MTSSSQLLETMCEQFEQLHHSLSGNGNGEKIQKGMTRIMAEAAMQALEITVAQVPRRSQVTLEGTPMYFGEPWDARHELGTNILLAHARTLLEAKDCTVEHYALLDDLTRQQDGTAAQFLDRMRDPPQSVCYEASFVDEAESHIARLTEAGRTRRQAMTDEVFLWTGVCGPRLRVQSGRPSCEMLDACYQRTKSRGADGYSGNRYHLLIHPSTFTHQQAGMRDILREISGGALPGAFINLHFSGTASYRVLYTRPDGHTRRQL